MYKFKYKVQNEQPEVFYFDTLQEVANLINLLCNSCKLQDILNVQKEYNIRFYLSKVNK